MNTLKRLFSFFSGRNEADGDRSTGASEDNLIHPPSKRQKKVTFADQKRQEAEAQQLSQQVSAQLCFSIDNEEEDSDSEFSNESASNALQSGNESEAEEGTVSPPRRSSPRQQLCIEDVIVRDASSNSQLESSQEEAGDQDSEQAADLCSEEGNQVQESPESVGPSINQKRALKLARKSLKRKRKESGVKTHERLAKKLLEDASSKMRTLKRSLDQSFKGVEELNCPICMDYIVSCRTAICGHSFCEMCISESMIHRKECPNCRKDIRKWVLSKSEIIDSAVKLMVSSKAENDDNAEELQRYKERVKAHEEWLSKQSVEPIKPGEKVDALDTEYIWCRAQVELKIQARGRKPLLYLHYEGWSRKYDEYIYVDSRRIAPLGLFTNRNDIPRYQNNSANNRAPMNYAQVIDSARNMQLNQDQIENAAVGHMEQIDINDPNQVLEEPNDENEGSVDSIDQRRNRDEPDPEQQQESVARGASSGAAGSSTAAQGANLNRDSNLGRNGEGPGSPNPFLRGRPPTRSSRSPFSFSIDSNRPHPVFSSSNPFFMVNSNNARNPFRPSGPVFSTSENRTTSSHSRRLQQREVVQSAAAASAANTSSLNRSVSLGQTSLVGLPFPRQSNREDTRAGHLYCGVPTYRQSNPGLLASSGADLTANRPQVREERISSPSSLFANRESRRLSVPSNTGNIMRGATQSNIFGASTSTIAERCCSFGSRNHPTQRQVTQARVNLRSRNRGEPASSATAPTDQEALNNEIPAATNLASTAQFASPFATSHNILSNGPPNEPQQEQPEQVPGSCDLLNPEAVVAPQLDEVQEEDLSQDHLQESNNIGQIISASASVVGATQIETLASPSATNIAANGANGAVNGEDMQQAGSTQQQQQSSPETSRLATDNAASKSMDKQ